MKDKLLLIIVSISLIIIGIIFYPFSKFFLFSLALIFIIFRVQHALKDKNSNSKLRKAARKGNINNLKKLIEEKRVDINGTDFNGRTALFEAVSYNNTEAAKILIKAGADVNIQTKSFNLNNLDKKQGDDKTTLIQASMFGNEEIVKELINAGADVNIEDERGWTALMYASDNGHIEIVKKLIQADVDVNKKTRATSFYQTALKRANKKGHKEIANLLKKHGARE